MKKTHIGICFGAVIAAASVPLWVGKEQPAELPNPTLAQHQDLTTFDGCGPEGTATKGDAYEENPLKNRWQRPKEIDLAITLDTLLKAKVDDPFDQNRAATITGYVPFVKPGGVESVNCGSSSDIDTHIYVVADASIDKAHGIIVEVTPRTRNSLWSQSWLKHNLEGRTVEFTGYVMMDQEHRVSSFNDNPKGKHNWRQSCAEIHPVTGIRMIE